MWERERDSQKKKWSLINPPNPPTSSSSSACRATDDLAALGDSTRAGPLPRKLKERPCSATSSARDRRTFPNLEAMATAGNPMIFLRKIVNLWNCCEVGMLVVLLLFSRAFSVFHAGQRSYFIVWNELTRGLARPDGLREPLVQPAPGWVLTSSVCQQWRGVLPGIGIKKSGCLKGSGLCLPWVHKQHHLPPIFWYSMKQCNIGRGRGGRGSEW